MEITTPTELKNVLASNKTAAAVYQKLSLTARQSYAAYIVAAENVKQRKCRAEHSLRMLLGLSGKFSSSC